MGKERSERSGQSNPRKAAYQPVTDAEAEAMLHEAGAPMPWARLDLLADLARMVDNAHGLRSGFEVSPEIEARREAQAAIKQARAAIPTLLRLLPELAAWSAYHADNPTLLTQPRTPEEWEAHRKHYADQRAAEMRMLVGLLTLPALSDVYQPFKPNLLPLDPGASGHWHYGAVLLWLGYRRVVGSEHVGSRQGPAARFIRLALMRAGYGDHTHDAIEKVIIRHPWAIAFGPRQDAQGDLSGD